MSLWATTNRTDYQLDNSHNDEEASNTGNPLNILLSLERRAIRQIHPTTLVEDQDNLKLNKSEKRYVNTYINRHI